MCQRWTVPPAEMADLATPLSYLCARWRGSVAARAPDSSDLEVRQKAMCLRKEEEETEDWAARNENRWENMRRITHWLGGTSEQGSMFPPATSAPLLFFTFVYFLTRSGE